MMDLENTTVHGALPLTKKQQAVKDMTVKQFNTYLGTCTEKDKNIFEYYRTIWQQNKGTDVRSLPINPNRLYDIMRVHPEYTSFQCKLVELAMTFSNTSHFNDCIGSSASRFPGQPVPIEATATTFGTTVKNVQMMTNYLHESIRISQKAEEMRLVYTPTK